MAPVHLIILNLVYDLSCIALPFDKVDKDFLRNPHTWEAKSITRFMIWMGPISSAFDILTFSLLYFIIVPMTTGQAYVHGAESAVRFYCLVSDRLVYRVHVVTDHGYPYAAFS